MDAYYAFDGRELQNERIIDLNRETAPEADGIAPENVPVWMAHRIERHDGSTDLVETCNALCAHAATMSNRADMFRRDVLTLQTEAEVAADNIRELMAQLETANEVAAIHRAERDAYLIELAKLRDRCQVLILEKEQIRHTYQTLLGTYVRQAVAAMHDAIEAGEIPQRLADDVNALRAVA